MKLIVHWDSEIDGAFRRRLERALGELQVDFADASGVDADPDAPAPVRLSILARQGQGVPDDADLIVLGGPGDFRETSRALRLDKPDIDDRTRRWIAFSEKLGAKLQRPALAKFAATDAIEDQRAVALAFPRDPLSTEFAHNHSPEILMERLAAMTARAEAAEQAIDKLELERFNSAQHAKQSEIQAAKERARIANLEQAVERLTALAESTAYALTGAPTDVRGAIAIAREHAWRARRAAAWAADAAEQFPDALAWPKARAHYSGETRNRLPHGYGVIVFRTGEGEVARYAGSFSDGARSGHGIATSEDGHVWTGQWKDNEAFGAGLLECPDRSRFEGEVAPDASGSPRQVRGWTWNAPPQGAKPAPQPHRAVTPILPSAQPVNG
jgi:hypothetical protein